MNNPEQLTREILDGAIDAVAGHGAETFTRADVERMLRECAVAWYGRGSRDALLAVRMSNACRDAGALQ